MNMNTTTADRALEQRAKAHCLQETNQNRAEAGMRPLRQLTTTYWRLHAAHWIQIKREMEAFDNHNQCGQHHGD